jgi:hypothetical protein
MNFLPIMVPSLSHKSYQQRYSYARFYRCYHTEKPQTEHHISILHVHNLNCTNSTSLPLRFIQHQNRYIRGWHKRYSCIVRKKRTQGKEGIIPLILTDSLCHFSQSRAQVFEALKKKIGFAEFPL